MEGRCAEEAIVWIVLLAGAVVFGLCMRMRRLAMFCTRHCTVCTVLYSVHGTVRGIAHKYIAEKLIGGMLALSIKKYLRNPLSLYGKTLVTLL